jgi:uncharacterized protein (TIGR02284 family)
MEYESVINVLNTLIVINNDRIEGYEAAAKETDEADLKDLFHRFVQTSQACKTELVTAVTKLGGTPEEGTRTTGKFFRVWMDVKAFLTGKERVSIFDSCEYGENIAAERYKEQIANNLYALTSHEQIMLNTQANLLKADLNKVVALRDSLAVPAY